MTVLACEKCRTKFEVPAAALTGGRKVRCTNCKHIWFQPDPKTPVQEERETSAADEQGFAADVRAEMSKDTPPEYKAEEPVPPSMADQTDGDLKLEDERPAGKKLSKRLLWLIFLIAALIIAMLAMAAQPYLHVTDSQNEAAGMENRAEANFVLTNGRSWVEAQGGRDILIVSADILNASLQARRIPAVRVVLRDGDSGEIRHSWSPMADNVTLNPGEKHNLKWGFTNADNENGKIALYFEEY